MDFYRIYVACILLYVVLSTDTRGVYVYRCKISGRANVCVDE